mmetsp:Transcript_1060/g.1041  ORF Transcript_1060/g.1041 Transcript_1060/m.1041 type:complete len:477 (-) Transcript_1060:372-1802(-)
MLNYCLMNNQGFDNLIHFKELYVELHPLELSLNGKFCEEVFKYLYTVFSYFAILKDQDIKSLSKENIEDIMSGMVENKSQFEKMIYFEILNIAQMNIKFSFTSNADLLNQTNMTPTLMFIVAMLINMRRVEFKFSPYVLHHNSKSLEIFSNQLKNHYLSECYTNRQLFRILTSVGLLGNLHETMNNFKTAIFSLVANPMRNGNLISGVYQNVQNFVRYTLYAISNVFTEISESIFNGINAITSYYETASKSKSKAVKKSDENEIDIEKEFIDNVHSIVGSLDTQNKIWFRFFICKELLARNLIIELPEIQQQEEAKAENKEETKKEQKEAVEEIEEVQQIEFDHIRPLGYKNRVFRFTNKFKNAPYFLVFSLHRLLKKVNYYIKVDKDIEKESRIRKPRYFSYTKELEPYSAIKAFAVDSMKRINVELPYSENISFIVSLSKSEVIFTENRILCITQEQDSDKYEDWFLLYSDIIS